MSRRWSKLVAILFVVVAICCGILFVQSNFDSIPKNEATLSDGSTIRLQRIGIGTVTYDSFPPWKATAAKVLPTRFQGWLGNRSTGAFSRGRDDLGLMFFRHSKSSEFPDYTQRSLRMEFVESTGHVFRHKITGYSVSQEYLFVGARSFPRRDKKFHLRLIEENADHPSMELEVVNPAYRPEYDEWTPEQLPISKTVEPYTVTLKRGPTDVTGTYLTKDDFEISSSHPKWNSENAKWGYTIFDVTGNQAHSFDELSPSEPAWKLQLRIRRSDDAEFEETEIFRTNLIDLPKDLSAVRLNSTGMADGIPFSVPFVSSAGKVQDDGDKLSVETTMQTELSTGSIFRGGNGGQVWFVESSRPLFQLQIQSTLEAEVNLLIAVKDQDGRRLSDKHPNSATYYQGNIPVKYIEFDPAPETKSVQLEVKVNRARTFEFFVSPRKDSTGANQ